MILGVVESKEHLSLAVVQCPAIRGDQNAFCTTFGVVYICFIICHNNRHGIISKERIGQCVHFFLGFRFNIPQFPLGCFSLFTSPSRVVATPPPEPLPVWVNLVRANNRAGGGVGKIPKFLVDLV